MNLDISKGQILAISSNSDVYRRGESYYKEGKIIDIGYEADSSNLSSIISAKVDGNYNNYNVKIKVNNDSVVKAYSCNCDANSIWRGACKHVIAVLFAVSDDRFRNTGRIRDNNRISNIIKTFEKQSYADITDELNLNFSKQSRIRVEPELFLENEKPPILRLYVGMEKMYVVKNIRDFLNNIKNEATVSYGKGLSIKHRLSDFDEYSKSLIALVETQFGILSSIQNLYSSMSFGSTIDRGLPLPEKVVDEFFCMNLGKDIGVNQKNLQKASAMVVDDSPNIKFELKEKRGEIIVVTPPMEYMLICGVSFDYIYSYNKVYRVSKSYSGALKQFDSGMGAKANNELRFLENDKKNFMTFVYPRLKKLGLVDADLEQVDTELIVPQKKLYFDCDGKKVLCKAVFDYSSRNGSLTENVNDLNKNLNRNLIEEFKITKFLEVMGFDYDQQKDMYVLSDEELIYELYSSGIETARQLADVFATDSFSKQSAVSSVKGGVGVRISGNLLQVKINMGGYKLSELLEAVSSYSVKKRYHRLKDGRFVNLEDEGIREATEIISVFDLTKKDFNKDIIELPKYRALHLDKIFNESKTSTGEIDENFKQITDDFNGFADIDFPVPESLQQIMRPYQKTGFKWLKTLTKYDFGGILADDMGLGKTLQVIALLLDEKQNGKYEKPSLVVAPNSLMYNWEHEIKKFAPSLRTVVLSGLPAKRQELFEASQNVDVFITTYDLLKRDIDIYEKRSFKFVIADEAQYIKNPNTLNASSIKQLKSEVRFALTGTPIENSLMELWSIFDFIMPGYLFGITRFVKYFETPILKDNDDNKAAQLQQQISPFIMRRLKSEVLKELPEKVSTTLYAEMYPEQRKIYIAHLLKAKGQLDDAIESGEYMRRRIEILSQLTRLRQISCHPSLFIDDYEGGSGKLDLTVETIESAIASGHRVLLFSQFTSMLNILLRRLQESEVQFFYLDGSTPSEMRTQMAKNFNAGERSVFLISLKAGGTGLNLTGADVVIHYDQWWNPAVMNQATDRAHRFGQEKIVQVINIVSRDSVEEKILELQDKKKNLVDSVIKEGENFITRMSVDEIKALFAEPV